MSKVNKKKPVSKKKEVINIDDLEPATLDEISLETQDTQRSWVAVRNKAGEDKKLRVEYKLGSYRDMALVNRKGTSENIEDQEDYWPLIILMYSIDPKFENVEDVSTRLPFGTVTAYGRLIERFNLSNPFLSSRSGSSP